LRLEGEDLLFCEYCVFGKQHRQSFLHVAQDDIFRN